MMNLASFTHLLKNTESIDHQENLKNLADVITEYPYFQAVRSLYLKELKKTGSFKYNSELKKTAAYTKDRSVLFDFIISQTYSQEKTTRQKKLKHTQATNSPQDPTAAEELLEIGTPIQFTQTEAHSFNQWLQLSAHKKIDRTPKKQDYKSTIIDNFIRKNPKISKVSKDTENKATPIIEPQDSYLMTATLARVYLEQKKYENAIKAYEILSLKYPEKSGFFADQIKRIKILQKNKS